MKRLLPTLRADQTSESLISVINTIQIDIFCGTVSCNAGGFISGMEFYCAGTV